MLKIYYAVRLELHLQLLKPRSDISGSKMKEKYKGKSDTDSSLALYLLLCLLLKTACVISASCILFQFYITYLGVDTEERSCSSLPVLPPRYTCVLRYYLCNVIS